MEARWPSNHFVVAATCHCLIITDGKLCKG